MESVVVLLVLLGLAVVVLPFVLLGLVIGLRRRERGLRAEVEELTQRIRDLEIEGARQRERPAEAPAPAAAPMTVRAPAPAAPRPAQAEPPLETVAVPPPTEAARRVVTPPQPPAGERYLSPSEPAAPSAPPPPPSSTAPPATATPGPIAPPAAPPAAPSRPIAPPAAVPPAAAPPAPPPPPRAAAVPPPPPPRPPGLGERLRGFDWERIVGVRLFSILAGVVLAIAAIYAVILSYEAGLVTPKVRFIVLTAVGAGLVVGSELRFARAYAITALSLAAGGVVTLFATFYAGHALWHFYPSLAAFALLALVTAAAVVLSIRRSSLVVAVLGLLGGFATPVLLSTGEDRPLSLFGYLLLLNVALAWVSYKRRWVILPWLSLAFTALYQAGWVERFLDRAEELPLALGIFTVFAVGGFFALRLAGRSGPQPAAARWSAVAAVPPVLLALHLATTSRLDVPWPLLLGFLALLALGVAAVAAWQGPSWIHNAGAAATAVVVAALLAGPAAGGTVALGAALLLFLAVYVAVPLGLARLGRALGPGAQSAALVAPAFAAYAALSPSLSAHWPLVFGFLAVALVGLAVVAAWEGPEWLYPAGALLTLAAVGGWLAGSFTEGDWPLLALFVALLVAALLVAPLLLQKLGRELRAEGRHAALTAPLLLLAFVRAAPADTAASPLAFLAPLLGLAAILSAWAVLRSDARVHVLSSGAAILAAAVWSGFHLDAGRLYPALLAYLLLGALLLAAPIVAERRGRPLSGALTAPLLLAALALVAFLARPLAGAALSGLVGLTALAALFQAALFLEAARGRNPLLALAGVVVGFVELALWAVTGFTAALFPALVAATVLSAVALGGTLLMAPRVEGAAAPAFRAGPFLALAGHAFVAFAAARRDLALPPTPWLAVLGVLDLGFVAAALLRRRGALAVGAAAATLLVLWAHLTGLDLEPPAGLVAAAAGLGAAAIFLAGHLAGRRTGAAPRAGLGTFGAAAVAALHGAQLFLIFGGDLPFAFLLPAHLALLAGLLALAWIAGAEALALSSATVAGLAGLVLCVATAEGQGVELAPGHALAIATAAWLVALAYPLLRGARGQREWFPFLAAAVASGLYLLAARKALLELGAGPYIGALPVLEAVLLLPHLRLLLRMEPPSQRDMRRLAVVAAAILALVTVAIPLQLEKQWWTIGWALLAAALAWLWRRVPHRGLLVWAAALLGASFVRLVPFFNVWIFGYHPRAETPIWNWYLYTYLVAAGAHLAASWWFHGGDDRPWQRGPRLSWLAGTSGALLLFLLLNIEIADYWSPPGGPIVFRFSAGVAPDLSYTIGWAVFAIGVLVAGVALRSRATRIAAIALLAVTVVKGFLHDLGHLSGLYRVGSFVGLAFSLAVVAVVLQRFVLRRADATAAGASHPESTP